MTAWWREREPSRLLRPPRLAAAVLRALVPGPYGFDLAVELDDAFRARVCRPGKTAHTRAVAWYWGQVLSANTFRLRGSAKRLRRGSFSSDVGSTRGGRRSLRLVGVLDDFRHSIRSLAKAPGFTLAAILTLALGIGAVTSIYSMVNAILVRPVPFRELGSLMIIGEVGPRRGLDGEAWTHPVEFELLRDQLVFDGLVGMRPYFITMTAPGEPLDVIGYRVSPEYFDILGIAPLHGRSFAPTGVDAVPERAVVLGHAFWQRRFGGDPEILGATLRLGEREMVVVGVLPPGAEYPAGTDLYAPLELSPEERASHERPQMVVLGRLAGGTHLAQARAAVDLISQRLAPTQPKWHKDLRLTVAPILEVISYGSSRLVGVLMGAAGFLLLLVCANVAGLQLARATTRSGEIALRLALGARRWRLVRQLLVESLCLTLSGAALGCLFAWCGSRILRLELADPALRYFFSGVNGIGVNAQVLAFAVLVAVGTALTSGLVPALHGSRADLNDLLKPGVSGGAAGVGGGRLRRALVVLEVGLAVVLVAGAVFMVQSVGLLSRFDRGFDDDVMTLRVRLRGDEYAVAETRLDFIRRASGQLRTLPGLASLAVADRLPGLTASRSVPFEIEGRGGDAASQPRAETPLVGVDYFAAVGIPILQGRAFKVPDENGSSVAVVSAALAARHWPNATPIGGRVRLEEGEWLTVVGVAADVSRAWNDRRPAVAVYRPSTRVAPRAVHFILKSSDPGPLLAAARERIWQIDPHLVLTQARTIADQIVDRSRGIRLVTGVTSCFAVAAFLASVGGIYALVAYAAARRSWEMGVRMALGARRRDVTRLFVTDGLKLTLIGLALGLPTAWLLTRALSVMARDAWTLGGNAAILAPLALVVLALAALASYLPARRATRTDPAVTLRRH